jgi:membrane protease subunit HflK
MSSGENGGWPPRRYRQDQDPLAALQDLAERWSHIWRRFNPWLVVPLLLFLYLLSGFYIVAPDERAVVLRFGRVAREAGPGPHYRAPWPVESALKVPVTQIRKEEIGFRTVAPGPPARYRPVDQEALMLTGDNNIVDLDFIVQYRIKPTPEGPRDYLFNVAQPQQAVRDAAEATMREIIGASKIDDALTEGKQRIQDDAQKMLQTILDEYRAGIEIVTVQLQDVSPPEAVSDAFKDVISAEQDKARMINEARGYDNDIVPKARGEAAQLLNEAQGYREAKVREAEGIAKRFVAILEEYVKAPDVTRRRLYLETMEEVLAQANKIIIDGDTTQPVVPYLPLGQLRPPPKAEAAAAPEG